MDVGLQGVWRWGSLTQKLVWENFPTVPFATAVRRCGSTADSRILARAMPKLTSIPYMSTSDIYPGGIL